MCTAPIQRAKSGLRLQSTQVLMLLKKQWFEPRRMGSLWFGGVVLV
jgi:hypothetical protein